MKTISSILLVGMLSSPPLMAMDSKDPLSTLPLSGKGSNDKKSKDHEEKIKRWNDLLDHTSRSGKSFRRDRTEESKGITLESDLMTILEEAGQEPGWDEENRKALHQVLFPNCQHRTQDWRDGRVCYGYYGDPPFLKGIGTGSFIATLTSANNEKLTLVLEAFHGRAKPEDWFPTLNLHYLTALIGLDTTQIPAVAEVLKLVKLRDDERGGYAHAVEYFYHLKPEQTPAILRFLRHFAESQDVESKKGKKGKKAKSKTREVPDLGYVIPGFVGLTLDHTNIIIDYLLSMPALISWSPWDISNTIQSLASQNVDGLRSTYDVQSLIGPHKEWTPGEITKLNKRFASMAPELRSTIITAVKIIDPQKKLEPYDLNKHIDILEVFPNPQDIVSLIEKCAKIGTTPEAIMYLFGGHQFYSREDFHYLLDNMKFKIADHEGITICEFFALLPKDLWENQLDRLIDEKRNPKKKETPEEVVRVRVSPLAQRFVRFFDTSTFLTLKERAAQSVAKLYWNILLESPQSEQQYRLSDLILHHAEELGIDRTEDEGLFHKAIDAIPKELRSIDQYARYIAYRALVKAKRAPFSFADVQCPPQIIAGVPVCVNAPYMPEFGKFMARDVSSSLNITYAQFMQAVDEMKTEVSRVTSLKEWFQDEKVRQFIESERYVDDIQLAWFLFKDFRHSPKHSFEATFNIFLRYEGFRKFLQRYAAGELRRYESYTIKYQDRNHMIYDDDLDKVIVKLNLQNEDYLGSPEFQALFVQSKTNIVGAQLRCIMRHIQDQDDAQPQGKGLSDRSREMLHLVKGLGEEVPFTYIQRRYLALKPGQKMRSINTGFVDGIQEAFCEVMLDLLDKEGPFVKPMPNNYGSTMHSTMPYYYNELLGPHLGLISSCPNRTFQEVVCQIGIYHRWDSKLSVPQALQKFYELLTPEYVVAKIRERMVKFGQESAEELTDDMLVKKLIDAQIFKSVSAESHPG